MAFKMKGNPMQRNFGVGSALKQGETEVTTATEDKPTIQSTLTEHKNIITGKIKKAVEGHKTARAEQKAKNKAKREAARAANKAKRAAKQEANRKRREERDANAAESAKRAGHGQMSKVGVGLPKGSSPAKIYSKPKGERTKY